MKSASWAIADDDLLKSASWAIADDGLLCDESVTLKHPKLNQARKSHNALK